MYGVADSFCSDPDSLIRKMLAITTLPECQIFFSFGVWQLIVINPMNNAFGGHSKIGDHRDVNLASSFVCRSVDCLKDARDFSLKPNECWPLFSLFLLASLASNQIADVGHCFVMFRTEE
jgi:hypothetical protein